MCKKDFFSYGSRCKQFESRPTCLHRVLSLFFDHKMGCARSAPTRNLWFLHLIVQEQGQTILRELLVLRLGSHMHTIAPLVKDSFGVVCLEVILELFLGWGGAAVFDTILPMHKNIQCIRIWQAKKSKA